MTKTTRFLAPLLIALGAAACGARSNHTTLPVETQGAVLSHYVRGESFDQIASEFRLADHDDARNAVRDAMLSVSRRYYHER